MVNGVVNQLVLIFAVHWHPAHKRTFGLVAADANTHAEWLIGLGKCFVTLPFLLELHEQTKASHGIKFNTNNPRS